jgi:hypothetical protein
MGKGKGARSEAHDLSGGPQENSGGTAGKVGEGEARGVRETEGQSHIGNHQPGQLGASSKQADLREG